MVKVYDNIIPDKLCQILIAAFESCKDQEFIDDDNCPCFTQVNVNHASRGMVKLINNSQNLSGIILSYTLTI